MIGKKFNIDRDKELYNRVYCTIDGVLTPVIYKASERDYITYTDLYVTNEKRLSQQTALTKSTSLSRLFKEVENSAEVSISPLCVFDFHSNIKSDNSNVVAWGSSYSSVQLSQSTTANQPTLGELGKGVNGFSPIFFKRDNSDFMSLNSSITVSGDFTMFFYIQPIAHPLHKQYRLLGKSDDNDMYISIGESINESYNISFASGSEYATTVSGYWQPSSKKLLITIQREGSKVYIRENGTQVATGTIPTSDFVFDQFGKIGNVSTPTFNGSLYHFSLYDGYISNDLKSIENSIIKKASLAKG